MGVEDLGKLTCTGIVAKEVIVVFQHIKVEEETFKRNERKKFSLSIERNPLI